MASPPWWFGDGSRLAGAAAWLSYRWYLTRRAVGAALCAVRLHAWVELPSAWPGEKWCRRCLKDMP